MINAINDLRRKWREQVDDLTRSIPSTQDATAFDLLTREAKRSTLEACIRELCDAVDGVKPRPLNEASTEKLYRWAPRMLRIMDLMIAAQDSGESELFGDLATQDFLNDIYDLFKQLANRGTS
jgi:hypothetical protein